MNDEQRIVYNTILQIVNNEDGKLFFLDAPAWTGKTFLIYLLLAKMKMVNNEHISIASSRIAAIHYWTVEQPIPLLRFQNS